MPDFDEAIRQDVEQEPSDELEDMNCQELLSGAVLAIAIGEGDLVLLTGDQPIV